MRWRVCGLPSGEEQVSIAFLLPSRVFHFFLFLALFRRRLHKLGILTFDMFSLLFLLFSLFLLFVFFFSFLFSFSLTFFFGLFYLFLLCDIFIVSRLFSKKQLVLRLLCQCLYLGTPIFAFMFSMSPCLKV